MRARVQLLRLMGLPVFESIPGLSQLVHVDTAELKRFVIYSGRGYYYRKYSLPKRKGGYRTIRQPGPRLKAIQAWILRHILDKLSPSPYATAFRRGRGLLDAVQPHIDNRYFLCLDIESFFPSIRKWRVEQVFARIGYLGYAADILASLCTAERVLPQGAVTSPALANLVASRLDLRIVGYVSKRNITYTRYADDLTFSCNNPGALAKVKAFVTKIIMHERFALNSRKTRVLGPRRRCRITGLVKDSSQPAFGIGRNKRRQMRAAFFNAIVNGKPSSDYPSEAHLQGWLAFLTSVDPDAARQMRDYCARLQKRASS